MVPVRRVHSFRDHSIGGMNWRPTRFVDGVPSSAVCDLCGVIPKRILPCMHPLCQSCHDASSQDGGGGRCPLDGQRFNEEECRSSRVPTSSVNTWKVHCWNEAHGCKFTGPLLEMQLHYDYRCDFHFVECLRCGDRVLDRNLPTHCLSGCGAGVSEARKERPSSGHTSLTLQDVSVTLEQLKKLMSNASHDNLLPTIQSKLNELTEYARKQDDWLTEIARNVKASKQSFKALPALLQEIAEVAKTTSSSTSTEIRYLREEVQKAIISKSSTKELREHARKQEDRLTEIADEVAASEKNLKAEIAQVAATISSTTSTEIRYLREEVQKATTSKPSINEFRKHAKNQEARLTEIAGEVATSEQNLKAEIAKVAATISTAMSTELRSLRSHPDEASTFVSSLPSCSENTLILRKLELFASLSLRALDSLRQAYSQQDPQSASACCKRRKQSCSVLHLTNVNASEKFKSVEYMLEVKNIDKEIVFQKSGVIFAPTTVLHSRDAYFTVQLKNSSGSLLMRIDFYRMRVDLESSMPTFIVTVLHTESEGCSFYAEPCNRDCLHVRGSWEHFSDIRDKLDIPGKQSFPL